MVKSDDFRAAVLAYPFPASEPLFSVELGDGFSQELYVYRATKECRTWQGGLPEFWAGALFNFLEDLGQDKYFHQIGQSGLYQILEANEVDRRLDGWIGSLTSGYIAVPKQPTLCILGHESKSFQSLVGEDSFGFFAVFRTHNPSNESNP
ncbi:MAG: hypothetical protein DWQ01_00440 [Planctomycetota bacterium]|nr:MAG: hypothetical protein DWQ01_00440 [Planctomycetota bacterium]